MAIEIRKTVIPDLNFPTKWQAVIFRNYGMLTNERIGKVLRCDAETVEREAIRLGIGNTPFSALWETKGYITIYRNNWFLLPTEQLVELLGISREKYEFNLKEEDFLGIKLGEFKPECEPVYYSPLTEKEIAETEIIRKKLLPFDLVPSSMPFDFSFDKTSAKAKTKKNDSNIFAHGYLTPCGDVFEVDSREYLPDSLLEKYRDAGTKGLWLHGVLSKLSYYPFDPTLSEGYEKRRERFKDLIERAAAYGIKIYMYFNEPRSVTKEIAEKYPHLIGNVDGEFYSLCLETEEVRDYFYNALKELLEVCNIGGLFSITMSENHTHCYSHTKCNCPRCKDKITMPESAVRVNNIIQSAVDAAGSDTEVIAFMWEWTTDRKWTHEDVIRAIDTGLNEKIALLSVSETRKPFEIGGIKGEVGDYSISNYGPGEYASRYLGYGVQKGRRAYAKIQANNSWECSAVPYLPCFDLVWEHLAALSEIGIENYMISWTHGGYPSPTFNMISSYAPGESLDDWYESYYGENAKKVHEGVRKICDGFREYPFSGAHMYSSPQNIGPANMWSLRADKKMSGMICNSWDDYKKWMAQFPYEIFISQTEKMLVLWKEGTEILKSIKGDERVDELIRMAEVSYIHLESDLVHTKYAHLKADLKKNREELISLMEYEKERTKKLISLVMEDGRIGFEASNHYYYTANLLKEKIINMDKLISELLGV